MERKKNLVFALIAAMIMTTIFTGTVAFAAGNAPLNLASDMDGLPSDPGVKITWTNQGGGAYSGYYIYRDGKKLNNGNAIYKGSYIDKDTTLSSGTTYTYRIAYSNNESEYDEIMFAPQLFTFNTPENVTAQVTGSNNDQIKISWKSFPGMYVKIFDGAASDYDIANDACIAKVDSSAGSYTTGKLANNTSYSFKLCYSNNYCNFPNSVSVSAKTGSKPAGGSDSPNGITVIKGPAISKAVASTKYVSMGKVKIDVNLDYGAYKEDGSTHYVYSTDVELYRNGKRIDKRKISGYYYTITTPVSYGKKDKFVVKTFMEIKGNKLPGQTATMNIRSSQMRKNTVKATRINAKQAVVRWNGVEGATGYRIMKGSKKVKDVKASVRKYTVRKKGAGKAKYKVLPLRKADGKTYKGKSGLAKPKSNKAKYSSAKSWKNFKYFTSRYVVNKVSLSGRTYTIKGFFYNSAHYTTLKKYKKLVISIVVDGKVVAKKTYKNVNMNLKAKSQRKRTYKIKGKAGADLRHGHSFANISVVCDPKMFN